MALFTAEELSAYLQDDDLKAGTVTLLVDLVTGVIDEVATFTEPYPVRVKAIALEVAARAYTNPSGLSSRTTSIDDYSTTDRWDAKAAGVFLTPSERDAVIIASGGSAGGGAFAVDTVSTTITHADICAINFGALYCSCGASLTLGWPLYETYL